MAAGQIRPVSAATCCFAHSVLLKWMTRKSRRNATLGARVLEKDEGPEITSHHSRVKTLINKNLPFDL